MLQLTTVSWFPPQTAMTNAETSFEMGEGQMQ